MELIEQIGSYAGLAAVVGLAVLSALYFSQARDVRRLRDVHEGRLPSMATPQLRAAQRAAASSTGRPAGTPAQPVGPPARPPEAQPTTVTRVGPPAAAPVATGAGPQTAAAKQKGEQGATAPEPVAASAKQESPERVAASGAGGTAEGGAATEAPAEPVEAPGPPEAGAPAPAPPRPAASGPPTQVADGGGNAQGGRPIPSLPPRPPGAAALRLGEASAARRGPWYVRLDQRQLVLVVAAALILGVGGVIGIVTLGGDDDTGGERVAGNAGKPVAPLDPSTITVAVLNGTSVAGAADQVANVVEDAGYQRGTVDNAAEQSAESVVLFADGAKPAARQVGRELDISQLELIDPDTEALVGTADVTVVVGADRAE